MRRRVGSMKVMRRGYLIALLTWPAQGLASPVALPAGMKLQQVVLDATSESALRVTGAEPLTVQLSGPGVLRGRVFLELPRRGKTSGVSLMRVFLDGQAIQQVVLNRRRLRGRLPAADVVPSEVSNLSVDVPPGGHSLELRLPAGVAGGAVLEFTPARPLSPPPATRTIEAFSPAPVALVPPEPDAVALRVPPPEQGERKHFRISAQGGAVVPSSGLSVGAAGGIDLSWILPIGRGARLLDQKLRLSLGAGDSMLSAQGKKIISGRGLDPNFAEYAAVEPIDLSLVYTLPFEWRWGDVYVGAGYALNFVQAQFQSFGRSSQVNDAASGLLFQLGVEIALGPGSVVVEARQSIVGADLGTLGAIGTETLSGTTLAVGYSYLF